MKTTILDAQIVAWLGRIGAAGAQHVKERFGIGRAWAYIRLAELTAGGLLEHRKVLHGWPGMYTATREGLNWQGLARLHVHRCRPASFEHAWQTASTAVALHRELPDWQLLAEREIGFFQADRKQLVAWARVGSVGSQPAYHRPDFALISPSGQVVAVEVELTPKDPRRLVKICRAWTRARHVEHVYYLATDSAARAVRRAAKAVHGTDVITVLDLDGAGRLAELERAKLERAGPERAGPERAGLERAGLERAELECAELERGKEALDVRAI